MASEVQICNLALSRLGADRIVSLSDNTLTAKLCNTFYDDVVEEVISEGEWTTAIFRAELAQTLNTPTFEFSHEYQLPTNPRFLRILEIDEEVPGANSYRIEQDKLLADLNAVKIKYLGFISDPQSYGPWLKRAIVSRLTLELAYNLTGNQSTVDRMEQRYEIDLAKGLAADGKQGSKRFTHSPTLTEVR